MYTVDHLFERFLKGNDFKNRHGVTVNGSAAEVLVVYCGYPGIDYKAVGTTAELCMEFDNLASLKGYFGLSSWAEINTLTPECLLERYVNGEAEVFVCIDSKSDDSVNLYFRLKDRQVGYFGADRGPWQPCEISNDVLSLIGFTLIQGRKDKMLPGAL